MNDYNKELIISKYITTVADRAKLAASMINLRTRLEYYEPSTAYSIEKLNHHVFSKQSVKEYIVNYIRKNKATINLRTAIQQTHPEYEIMLDKLLVLR